VCIVGVDEVDLNRRYISHIVRRRRPPTGASTVATAATRRTSSRTPARGRHVQPSGALECAYSSETGYTCGTSTTAVDGRPRRVP
jgi:hypothetical protein